MKDLKQQYLNGKKISCWKNFDKAITKVLIGYFYLKINNIPERRNYKIFLKIHQDLMMQIRKVP